MESKNKGIKIETMVDHYLTMISDISTDSFFEGDKGTKQKIISELCRAVRAFSSNMHYVKEQIDWKMSDGDQILDPEWYDHFCDQHYKFTSNGSSYWLERGVFNNLVLFPSANVLELCCGDGYNAYHFYSKMCKNIYSIDRDKSAHDHAVLNFGHVENITFILGDIIYDLPDDKFDVVIWDAAIEHFTEDEIFLLMNSIKEKLGDGILTGHTIKERDDGSSQLDEHEREFTSKEDLAQFFVPFFKNVLVFETIHPERHNYYFYASDSPIPFGEGWRGSLRISKD